MDFLLELLVQLLLEFVFEAGWDGTRWLFRNRVGRVVLSLLIGVGFGSFWGHHLSGQADYPNLLWVSAALGGLALARLLAGRVPRDFLAPGFTSYLLTPPWRWHLDRVWTFLALNAGLVGGILLSFRPIG